VVRRKHAFFVIYNVRMHIFCDASRLTVKQKLHRSTMGYSFSVLGPKVVPMGSYTVAPMDFHKVALALEVPKVV
jgi:hypothetical protein